MRQSSFCIPCLQGMNAFMTLVMLDYVLVTVICIACGLARVKLVTWQGFGIFGHWVNELNGVHVVQNKCAMSSGKRNIFRPIHLEGEMLVN